VQTERRATHARPGWLPPHGPARAAVGFHADGLGVRGCRGAERERQDRRLDGRIHTLNPDGTGLTRLTTGQHALPAWSPDGNRLAFNDFALSADRSVFLMNADRSGLTNGGMLDYFLVRSPDGSKLAYIGDWEGEEPRPCDTGGDCDQYIYVMNADGSDKRVITTSGSDSDLEWSPDGTRLAFARGWDYDVTDIYVINSDGSNLRRLTTDRNGAASPDWSPEGTKIAFARSGGGVYVIGVDATDERQLSALWAERGEPEWSPDGTKVAFTSEWPDGGARTWVMDADGKNQTLLSPALDGANSPAWQPTRCTIVGTAGDDVLVGTAGDDVICGMGGNDNLAGGGGYDLLRGGLGNDYLRGEVGSDLLSGGFGTDTLLGGSGADQLAGGPGVDLAAYWGQTKPVTVTIGDGPNDGAALERDDVRGDVEQLAGGKADDTLTGNAGDNRLGGGAGNDRLTGGEGRDQLVGGDGDDIHDADDGVRDSLTCGNGFDRALADSIDWISTTCETQ
jgi:Tol biopolymer transport system component